MIKRDAKPHVIVVERVDEKTGDIHWTVEHNEDCVEEEFGFGGKTMMYHTCGVQDVCDNTGMDELAGALGLETAFAIKPGRYTVIGVYSYDSYTREGDFWLEVQA